jgi:hypothetical protein
MALNDLGGEARQVYQSLLPLLHIGEEGKRVFNMRQIVAAVRDFGARGLPLPADHA